jgi:2-polyprenyl-3-methyl-5-hydroxy-6-metoxy-1,4-benzoquinol methylase
MFEQAASISDFLRLWLSRNLLAPAEQETLNSYYAGYQRRFPDRVQHYYRRQIQDVLDLIEARPGARVLEIGCGTGTESLWMAMHGATVEAIELAKPRFEVANARKAVVESDLGRKLTCEFINGSLLDVDAARQYDIVWMEQAFHHLEPRDQVVEKIAALLRPGGHVVVSEANALNPLLQAQLFLQRGFRTLGEFTDETGRRYPYGNERIVSASRLARLLAKAGIETISTEHFRVFPNSPLWDHLLDVERSVPQWLRPLFTHYNYVGRKTAR